MKNYYQQKKGGWCLEPVIYAKTVKQIRCYRFFQQLVREYESAEPGRRSEIDLRDVMTAQQYVRAIEQGLQQYVPAQYRDAVFDHMVDGVEYYELEEKYYLSRSSMKRYAQVFVWGVAEALGENFTSEPGSAGEAAG